MQLEGPPQDDHECEFSDDEDDLMLNKLLPKGEIWNLSMKLAASHRETMILNQEVARDKALSISYRKAAMVAESLVGHDLTTRRLVTQESLTNDLNNVGATPKSRVEAKLWGELDGHQEVSYEDESTIDTLNVTPKTDIVNWLLEELRDQETNTHIAKMQAYVKTRV